MLAIGFLKNGVVHHACFSLPDISVLSREDKKVIVSGFSRSGSNLITEIVRGSGEFIFTDAILAPSGSSFVAQYWIEDRSFLSDSFVKMPRYGTKQVTSVPNFSWERLSILLRKYELFVVFCVRHPVSASLSGFVRNLPWKDGGDTWWLYKGANRREITKKLDDFDFDEDRFIRDTIETYEFGCNIYSRLLQQFPEKVLVVRLEDVIINIAEEVDRICAFLEVSCTQQMLEPWKYLRHEPIKRRRGSGLDVSQIDPYKRLGSSYSGFYVGKEDFVDRLTENLRDYISFWGYEG